MLALATARLLVEKNLRTMTVVLSVARFLE
jgi:hypothetical protein